MEARLWVVLALSCVAARAWSLEQEDSSEEVSSSEGRGRQGRFFHNLWPLHLHARIGPLLGHVGNGPHHVSTLISPEREDLPSAASDEDEGVGGAVWEGGRPSAVFVNRPWSDNQEGGFFGLGFPALQPWWKGPHVCNVRKEVDDDQDENGTLAFAFNFQSKQCQETEDFFLCTTKIRTMNESKTITDKYVCCHGYKRRKDGRPGCSEVNLKNLMTTMKDIGASKFVDLIEDSKLADEFNKENMTIFSPTNIALKDFEQTNEVTNEHEDQQARVVRGHAAKGMLLLGDLGDEMTLETIDGRSSIRINEFYNPAKLTTANCVPIVSSNNVATNGVVHVVDETLPSPNKTLLEIVQDDPRFSILRTLLPKTDLEELLKDPKVHYTLLAPSDDAFSKVNKETLRKWQSGESCLEKLLRGHVLPHVICTTAVPSSARVRNLNGEPVTLERDEEKLLADGSAVVARDLMATNGVLHTLDQLMMFQDSKSLMQTLRDSKMTDLVHLIESANLTSAFESLDNFTFFAPSEDALKEVSLKEWEDMRSSERLAQTLSLHTVKSKLSPRSFFNNMLLNTAFDDHQIRLNVFPRAFSFERPTVTAQCARVLSASSPVCGGTVYVIDQVMRPPEASVLDVLESAGNFEIFLRLVNESGLEDQLRTNAGPFTVLAPTDQAFMRLPKNMLTNLKAEDAQALVKQHVLPEMACKSGVGHNSFLSRLEYRSLDGTTVPTQRSLRGNVYFGGSRVSRGDLVARNGVVQVVEKVLNVQDEHLPGFGFNFALHPFFRTL